MLPARLVVSHKPTAHHGDPDPPEPALKAGHVGGLRGG
jgi:hypothetical protein